MNGTANPGARQSVQLRISERRALFITGDVISVILAVLSALAAWAYVADEYFQGDFILRNSWWIVILTLLWLLLANVNNFYYWRVSGNIWRSLRQLLQINIQLLLVYMVIFFVSPRDALPRLFILYYSVLSFLYIILWRSVFWLLVTSRTSFQRRAVIVGTGWAARTIVETLRDEAVGEYAVVGLVADFDPRDTLTEMVPLLGSGRNLAEIVQQEAISEIVLADDAPLNGDVFQSVMDCYEKGITVVPMPLLYEEVTGRVPIEHVGQDEWKIILPLEAHGFFSPFQALKRVIDIVFSCVGLLLFGLLLPFIALAIRLDSKGPVFYTQERLGKGGKPFRIIKLRSMVPDAERAGPQWARRDDPRITRVGRILRKTRLDELPQFINILRGEMSLVGPRAERPHFVDQLAKQIPFYRTRLVVRPGATGWAQVQYAYGNTVEDALVKLQYDLYYIRHRSLFLDTLIILRTIGKMLSFSGT
ncbi:MAG: sugar transferase [Chloroflexi bacterium]|nr:sugar transferase [Chloroflexota bacterium]